MDTTCLMLQAVCMTLCCAATAPVCLPVQKRSCLPTALGCSAGWPLLKAMWHCDSSLSTTTGQGHGRRGRECVYGGFMCAYACTNLHCIPVSAHVCMSHVRMCACRNQAHAVVSIALVSIGYANVLAGCMSAKVGNAHACVHAPKH